MIIFWTKLSAYIIFDCVAWTCSTVYYCKCNKITLTYEYVDFWTEIAIFIYYFIIKLFWKCNLIKPNLVLGDLTLPNNNIFSQLTELHKIIWCWSCYAIFSNNYLFKKTWLYIKQNLAYFSLPKCNAIRPNQSDCNYEQASIWLTEMVSWTPSSPITYVLLRREARLRSSSNACIVSASNPPANCIDK